MDHPVPKFHWGFREMDISQTLAHKEISGKFQFGSFPVSSIPLENSKATTVSLPHAKSITLAHLFSVPRLIMEMGVLLWSIPPVCSLFIPKIGFRLFPPKAFRWRGMTRSFFPRLAFPIVESYLTIFDPNWLARVPTHPDRSPWTSWAKPRISAWDFVVARLQQNWPTWSPWFQHVQVCGTDDY